MLPLALGGSRLRAPGTTWRRAVGAALLAPLTLTALTALGGCDALPGAGSSEPEAPDPAESLSFSFDLLGGERYIDQTLTIANKGTEPVVFEAVLTALDQDGEPLEDVEVDTVYGSQVGQLVVVPGQDLDIVKFSGRGARDAVDVAVDLEAVEVVDFPAVTAPVDAVPVDAKGAEVRYPGLLDRVELRNPNDEAVQVRTVYIVWDRPPAGAPQQAEVAVELAPRTTVPAGGKAVVRPSQRSLSIIRAYAGTNASSIKAHFVADP